MDEQALTAGLRSIGRAYRRECRGRRLHPTVLHLGVLDGEQVEVPHDPTIDAGFGADLLERILDQVDPAAVLPWITRGGSLAPGDHDFIWYAAARAAFGRHGHPLRAFYLITRDGWLDLVSEQSALWVAPSRMREHHQVCTGSLVCIRSRYACNVCRSESARAVPLP